MLSVSITDHATPFLDRLINAAASPALRHVVGRSGRNKYVSHFQALDRARHRAHVAFHFYGRAARNTSYRVAGDDVSIVVSQEGVAQRYFGGTVRARRVKALTIPARPEAEGKSAREFPDLFPVRKKTGLGGGQAKGFLARKDGNRIRVMYWLRASVHQDPDPSVIPSDNALWAAIEPDLDSFINRLQERSQ